MMVCDDISSPIMFLLRLAVLTDLGDGMILVITRRVAQETFLESRVLLIVLIILSDIVIPVPIVLPTSGRAFSGGSFRV